MAAPTVEQAAGPRFWVGPAVSWASVGSHCSPQYGIAASPVRRPRWGLETSSGTPTSGCPSPAPRSRAHLRVSVGWPRTPLSLLSLGSFLNTNGDLDPAGLKVRVSGRRQICSLTLPKPYACPATSPFQKNRGGCSHVPFLQKKINAQGGIP